MRISVIIARVFGRIRSHADLKASIQSCLVRHIFDLWLPITVDCHTDADAGAVVAAAASESLHLAAHLRVAA